MRRSVLRISVVLYALAVLAGGAWWAWREFWSGEQFIAAVAEGIETGDFSRAERLKRWGADTEVWRETDSGQQLLDALGANDPEPRTIQRARTLIKLGAKVAAKGRGDWTPLHFAAAYGLRDVAKLLLTHGAEVNCRAEDGRTPLHLAAFFRHRDTAEFLLAHGANVGGKANDGSTPLHRADQDTADLLLAHGAKVDARDEAGWTPLHNAAYWHKGLGLIDLLLAQGAHVDARTSKSALGGGAREYLPRVPKGSTTLHIALIRHRNDIPSLLLGYGADPHLKNEAGITPINLWPELAEIVKEVEAKKAGRKQPAQTKVATP